MTLDVSVPTMPFLADTGDDVNENSIVVMLRYRAFRELFMGDAAKPAKRACSHSVTPSNVEGQRKI